jgi:hypothetical protein
MLSRLISNIENCVTVTELKIVLINHAMIQMHQQL